MFDSIFNAFMVGFGWVNDAIVKVMDYVVGWLLRLPTDVALITLAVMTSLVMVLIRKWTTDQDFLRRSDSDQKVQTRLVKEAKARKDKAEKRQHADLINLIKMRAMKYELKPLLWSLVPVALLATWGFDRLGFLPPAAGEEVEVRAYVPTTAIGTRHPHIAPVTGLEALPGKDSKVPGWVQDVVADPADANGNGMAVWKLRGQASPQPYKLDIAFENRVYSTELLIGQKTYSKPVAALEGPPPVTVELKMRKVKLFGHVPGLMEGYHMAKNLIFRTNDPTDTGAEFLPPWVVAYLLVAIPMVYLLKKVLRIY